MVAQQQESLVGRSVSQLVIERVSEREGINPAEIEPPLYDVIDPDALDSIFVTPSKSTQKRRVDFAYRDYWITVEGADEVTIRVSQQTDSNNAMGALCPGCKENDGEMLSRESTEKGLLVSFECPACGHTWEVGF